ncbi:MAG TPA: inositol monophosphatase family protein, partial [Acidimicrobiales bacterium]
MDPIGLKAVELDALAELATRLATDAGALVLRHQPETRTDVQTKSSATDMVTEVDRASESLIVSRIRSARPGDAIEGEEGTADGGISGVTWLVDPLDGTTNYLYDYPAYSVSVAVLSGGVAAVGVVFDPVRGELFRAVAGRGATRSGVPLHLSSGPALDSALVGTGFSYEAARRAHQAFALTAVLPRVRDIRRGGSAALDLCWVAAGRLDAFYERGLQPWDRAAGALVAAEAGAWVGAGRRP